MGSFIQKVVYRNHFYSLEQTCCVLERQRYQEPESYHNCLPEVLLSPQKSQIKYDRRQSFIANQYPYNCILKLSFIIQENEEQKMQLATGILVAPNIIYTAGHFLRDYQISLASTFKKIQIYDHTNCQRSTEIYIYSIEHLQYYFPRPKFNASSQLIQNDFGVIILNRSIKRQKYLTVGLNFNMMNYLCTISGYPAQQNFLEKSWTDQHKMTNRCTQITNEYIEYDIDTTPGQSGSPVLIEPIKGYYFVVGIHSGFYLSKKIGNKKIKNFLFRDDLKQNKGLYEKDKFNSACKLSTQVVNEITEWIGDKFSKNIDKYIVKTVDLEGINISFPQRYYSKGYGSQVEDDFNVQINSYIQTSSNILSPSQYLKKANYYFKRQSNRKSIMFCEKLLNSTNLTLLQYVQVYNLLGLNYQQLKSFQIADSYYKVSMHLVQRNRRSKPQVYAEVCNNIGTMYLQKNKENSGQAEQIFSNAEKKLRLNSCINCQQYAATLTNMALASNDTPSLKQDAIKRLKKALQILENISTPTKCYTNGKILVLKHLLKFLFERKQYQEWCQHIIEHFQTIIQIKLKEGVYDEDSELQDLRKQCNIVSETIATAGQEAAISMTSINLAIESVKNQEYQKNNQIIKNNNRDKKFHMNYETFNQELLKQIQQIFLMDDEQHSNILFRISIVFQDIFKNKKNEKTEEIEQKIKIFMQAYMKNS